MNKIDILNRDKFVDDLLSGDSYEVISKNNEELKKFVETISMMR